MTDVPPSLKEAFHVFNIVAHWTTPVVALFSFFGSLIVLVIFSHSLLRRGRKKPLSMHAKLLRLAMVNLCLSDLFVSLLHMTMPTDLFNNAIIERFPQIEDLIVILSLINITSWLNTIASQTAATVCLGVSILVAARAVFGGRQIHRLWPYGLLFFLFTFVLPFLHFTIWTGVFIWASWTSDDLSELVYDIMYGEQALLVFIGEMLLVAIFVIILIVIMRSHKFKKLDPSEKMFLTKFSRYLPPFLLCSTIAVLFFGLSTAQDWVTTTFPFLKLLYFVSDGTIGALMLCVTPLQGLMNSIVLLINTFTGLKASIARFVRRKTPVTELASEIIDNQEFNPENWQRNTLGYSYVGMADSMPTSLQGINSIEKPLSTLSVTPTDHTSFPPEPHDDQQT